MHHVFLSYVQQDSALIDKLAAALRAAGVVIWRATDNLEPGVRWSAAIRNAIVQGRFFLACFSENYTRRQRTYMSEELRTAVDEVRKRPYDLPWFIPVRLAECTIPEYSISATETLADLQRVDLFPDWDSGYQKLLKLLRSRLEDTSVSSALTAAASFTAPAPAVAHSASPILITPDEREIYCVVETKGAIAVIENMPVAGAGLKTKAIIDLNRSGSTARPERLALNPAGTTIYVTDPPSDEVIVIDRGHNNAVVDRIVVGRIPQSIVFTPDGKKGYVSNQGPIPLGTISVIDTKTNRVVRTIRGMNIPEGLALNPKTNRLYVTSQGGYGT